MTSPETRRHVFVSYSHQDSEYLDRLQVHLSPFERDGIDTWADTKIKAGQDWQHEIDAALNQAIAVILLISADFLASEFITNKELPPLLLKAQTEGVTIIPVILKPCAWKENPDLARLQSINDPKEPVDTLQSAA